MQKLKKKVSTNPVDKIVNKAANNNKIKILKTTE